MSPTWQFPTLLPKTLEEVRGGGVGSEERERVTTTNIVHVTTKNRVRTTEGVLVEGRRKRERQREAEGRRKRERQRENPELNWASLVGESEAGRAETTEKCALVWSK